MRRAFENVNVQVSVTSRTDGTVPWQSVSLFSCLGKLLVCD